jgi:primosomal protein N' (replication factor Y)
MNQRGLFDAEPGPPPVPSAPSASAASPVNPRLAVSSSVDAAEEPALLVLVAVMAPVPRPLTYVVPRGMAVPLPGTRVLVPLGPREVTGIVLPGPIPPGSMVGIRPLADVLDDAPLWSPDLMETARFCSEYYAAPMGDVVRAALPPGLTPRSARQWALTPAGQMARHHPEAAGLSAPERGVLEALSEAPRAPVWLAQRLHVGPARLARLAARGLVADHTLLTRGQDAPTQSLWRALNPSPLPPLPPRAPALAALDAYLRSQPAGVAQDELTARFPGATRHLKKLATTGRVESTLVPVELTDPYASFPTPRAPDPSELTGEQRAAIDALCAGADARAFGAYLLEGVTGSGKTEVYLHTLAHVRAQGRTALILVPEIALTPALAARFRGRVPGGIAILHSGLSPSERLAAYDAARAGRVGAVLGARSAIFAPLWNLGLIVVDEEHEGSYKQEESPRYQARDLALVRARAAGAVCVLGSATPSLESVHGARAGRLTHLELTQRPGHRTLPSVELIDLRIKPAAELREHSKPVTQGSRVTILSTALLHALDETLLRKEQALIFLNRRGYSTSVICDDCGLPLACPNCAVSLTHHSPRGTLHASQDKLLGLLRCHYCDHQQPVPDECPHCKGHNLFPLGLGIQRVEAEVAARFPKARLGRLDRDAVRKKGSLERTLQQFARGDLDILIGTQMLAKGHDYPGVTLVGVVAADMSLRMPDWRAAERTLQLLTQVSGRAGRGGKAGRVLIQTWCPEHEAMQCAVTHDVRRFAHSELPLREMLDYPPFSRLCLVRVEGQDMDATTACVNQVAGVLTAAARPMGDGVSVLGPAPAPLARLKDTWRFQVLIKARTHAQRSALLAVLKQRVTVPANVRVVVDVDPGSML